MRRQSKHGCTENKKPRTLLELEHAACTGLMSNGRACICASGQEKGSGTGLALKRDKKWECLAWGKRKCKKQL